MPSTGTSRPPTSATERGSSSRKPIGTSPYSGWDSRRRATCAPTTPAPMISTGLPTRWRLRAQRWANDRTMRPMPTPSSENSQPRSQSVWLGSCPLKSIPSIATAIAATDTPLSTGTTPSSTSARRRVR